MAASQDGPGGEPGGEHCASAEIDIGACRLVTDELVNAMRRLIPQLSSSNPPPTRSELEEIVSSPASTLFVARRRDRIVGALTLVAYRIPTGLRTRIEDVVVDGSSRGERVGERLSAAALDAARAMGARSTDLTSRPSREAANRLYTRMGFELRESNVYRYPL